MSNPETVKKHQDSLNKSGKRGSQKLTDADVLEIVELLKQEWPINKIAANFDIDISTVYSIRQGKSWSRITGIKPGTRKQNRVGPEEINIIRDRIASNTPLYKIADELGVCSRTIRDWSIRLEIRKVK